VNNQASPQNPESSLGKVAPKYLGLHILAEFWGCSHIDDPVRIENALIDSAKAAGASILHVNLHHFGKGLGVTGVLMLAESHISIHSWPELGYAALDVFICGKGDAHGAIASLKSSFKPTEFSLTEHMRGGRRHD
jgi:S-adenosylmethionine decarboxylase